MGTHINVSHIAATPPPMELTAPVKLVEVDGRRLVFEVEVRDALELISTGTHERFVINKNKFDEKVSRKKGI